MLRYIIDLKVHFIERPAQGLATVDDQAHHTGAHGLPEPTSYDDTTSQTSTSTFET